MSGLIFYGLALSAILILLRLLWVFPGAYISMLIRRNVLGQEVRMPGVKHIFVVGWTGMRGVVALAAAISLPEVLDNGAPFPQRNMIIFLTFAVIIVTLVGQGLTLPPLIRALGITGSSSLAEEEHKARQALLRAALAHLNEVRERDSEEFAEIYDDVAKTYHVKLGKFSGLTDESKLNAQRKLWKRAGLMRDLLRVERKTAVGMRDSGDIDDEVLRQLEHELDLSDARLALVDQNAARKVK
jgi:CPA1 family monovalent cation:H+ antiporter